MAALNRLGPSRVKWDDQHTGIQIDATREVITCTLIRSTDILRQNIPGEVYAVGSFVTTYYELRQVVQPLKQQQLRLFYTSDGYALTEEDKTFHVLTAIEQTDLKRFVKDWAENQLRQRVASHAFFVEQTLRCSFPYALLREALQMIVFSRYDWYGPGEGNCLLFHVTPSTLFIVYQDWLRFSCVCFPLPEDYEGPRNEEGHVLPLDLLLPGPGIGVLLQAFPKPPVAVKEQLVCEGSFFRIRDTSNACSGRILFRSIVHQRELVIPLVDGPLIQYRSWETLAEMIDDVSWSALLEIDRLVLEGLLTNLFPETFDWPAWMTLVFEPQKQQLQLEIPDKYEKKKETTAKIQAIEGKGSITSMTVSPDDLISRLSIHTSETVVLEAYSQLYVKIRTGKSSKPISVLHVIGKVRPIM